MTNEENSEVKQTGNRNNRNTVIIAVVIVLLIAGLTVSAFTGVFDNFTGLLPGIGVNGEDDEDINGTGAVVATVNGEEITGVEFQNMMEQEKQRLLAQGIDLDSEEVALLIPEIEAAVLNRLIGMHLVQQKAEEEGLEATSEEVEKRYLEYAEMFGGEEQFKQQIEAAGMTLDHFIEEVSRELTIELYLSAYIEEQKEKGNLDYSDEEMEEKENELLNDLIEELREESEINIYL